jgi:DNA-binding NarL/FixJ family response regulator
VGKFRVLLIDDSEIVRLTTTALLEDGPYDVVEAGSAAEGRAKLAGGDFDVVIVDQHLGDGLGTDLIPEVRRALPAARVVVMSGSATPEELKGADLVLLKGEAPDAMLALLERTLRR